MIEIDNEGNVIEPNSIYREKIRIEALKLAVELLKDSIRLPITEQDIDEIKFGSTQLADFFIKYITMGHENDDTEDNN